jgi:HAD domain in Swiss Army Knife RNA repair proteins
MRARVFLDFDGVLNPETRPPPGPFTDWMTAHVDRMTITWSPTVACFISQLAKHAEVLWLTSWAEDAQIHLEPLMGLPRLELAGTDEFEAPWRWWKHDVVMGLWENDHRPFVWIDDDLALFDDTLEWVSALSSDHALAIAPDPSIGLTPSDLDRIDHFIAGHPPT